LQRVGRGFQLGIGDPVGVQALAHVRFVAGVVVPGGVGGGEAGGQVVHVVHGIALVVDAAKQGGNVHRGGLQLHADCGHVGGQHGGQQFRDGVALGVAPGDDQRLQLAVDFLVTGAGAGVRGAVGVQGPAVLFEELLGGVEVDLVAVQVFRQPVDGVLILPLGQAVGGVDNGAVAAGVLAGELVAVEAVGDGLADVRAVG